MIKVFAPGVIKLFGEHAVVYGKPALAATIDRGIYVECEKENKLVVETVGVPSSLRYFPTEKRAEALGSERFFAYIDTALRVAEEQWGSVRARFTIKSDLPPGIGAATSAAVSVGILKAYSLCAGVDVDAYSLAKLGHRVELEVQGIASPMDTAATSIGGVLKIWANPFRLEKLNVRLPPFYIAVLPRIGTTREIVAEVKAFLGRRRSAANIIEVIGGLVEEAHACLLAGDLECLGELMYMNNWLLGALGVVDGRVVTLLEMARPFIYGGKVSGAGRGGVVLLLPREGAMVERVLSSLGHVYHRVSITETGAAAV